MALDMDKEFDRHQKGWESFAKFLSLGTIAVLIIVGPAKAFGELMSLLSVPDMIGDVLSDVTQSPFLLLMIIAVILIITGMFLESIAQIILLTPLLLPPTGS